MSYQRYFPFKLFPWEKFVTALICTYKENGRPRWPELFFYAGRGAGKNAFAEFISFCLMSKANGIDFYDVDVCANSEDQARITFDGLWEILQADDSNFRKGFEWNKVFIRNKATRSKLRYRTDNPKSKDGMRSGCLIFDEIHQYENWNNLNVFKTGLGKRQNPRILYLTTDGDVRDGPLDALKEKGRAILNGDAEDNGFLPMIFCLDSSDEVNNESMWVKANPSLPYLPDLMDEVRREYADYKLDPTKSFDFMTKRMNLPQGRKDIEVASWDDLMLASRDQGDLDGRSCVIGIDFAKTSDMVGGCVLFRDGDEWEAVIHGWFCTASLDASRIKAPLDDWAKAGLLTIVNDVEIDPVLIARWCHEQEGMYDVKTVAIDYYRHTLMKRALDEQGFAAGGKDARCVMTRPSDVMRVQPSITSAFRRQNIAWGDNPLARWAANNAKLEPRPNNNYVYGKIEPRSRKTDPFMAFVAAFCVADRLEEQEAAPIEMMEPMFF